jgi:hypothetical protein
MTMSTSKPTNANESTDRPFLKAVDVAGQVWRHPNPAELYRFVAARDELLKVIATGRR